MFQRSGIGPDDEWSYTATKPVDGPADGTSVSSRTYHEPLPRLWRYYSTRMVGRIGAKNFTLFLLFFDDN